MKRIIKQLLIIAGLAQLYKQARAEESCSLAGSCDKKGGVTPQVKQILETNISFTGNQVKDSKEWKFENNTYVVKATGGLVAEAHDKILRDLGLVAKKGVEPIIFTKTKIIPKSSYENVVCSEITDVVGQARKLALGYTSLKDIASQRTVQDAVVNEYVNRYYKELIKAAIQGIGINDFIFNPTNLYFKDKSLDVTKATLLDVDALAIPQIPFYLLDKKFGISNEKVKDVLIAYVGSPEYEFHKMEKLKAISNSEPYEYYKENYNKIEEAVKNAGKDQSQLSTEELMRLQFCYFGNIKYTGCDKYGKSFMERNVDGFPVDAEYPSGNFLPHRDVCRKSFPVTISFSPKESDPQKKSEYALLQRCPETPSSLAR